MKDEIGLFQPLTDVMGRYYDKLIVENLTALDPILEMLKKEREKKPPLTEAQKREQELEWKIRELEGRIEESIKCLKGEFDNDY